MTNELLIAIIGIIATIVSSTATYFISKKMAMRKFKQVQFSLKQEVFLNFDKAIATFELLSYCDSPQTLVVYLLNCHKFANPQSKEKIELSLKLIDDVKNSKSTIQELLFSLKDCSFTLSTELALDKDAIVGKSC